jgi:DNA-binding response OmpR family regulator
VVDDDPNLLRMPRRRFVLAGYTVPAVEDSQAASRAMQAQEPDLVVLDVMLPELDGLEVAAGREDRGLRSTTPYVAVTVERVAIVIWRSCWSHPRLIFTRQT